MDKVIAGKLTNYQTISYKTLAIAIIMQLYRVKQLSNNTEAIDQSSTALPIIKHNQSLNPNAFFILLAPIFGCIGLFILFYIMFFKPIIELGRYRSRNEHQQEIELEEVVGVSNDQGRLQDM